MQRNNNNHRDFSNQVRRLCSISCCETSARHIQLEAEEARFFTSLAQVRHLKKKEFLLHAGDVCRYETFVLEGCLRNYYLDDKGDEHIL